GEAAHQRAGVPGGDGGGRLQGDDGPDRLRRAVGDPRPGGAVALGAAGRLADRAAAGRLPANATAALPAARQGAGAGEGEAGIVSRKPKDGVLTLDRWQGSAPTGVTKRPTPQEAPPCLPYPLSSGSATPPLSCVAPTAT